jgi:cytochrome c oxidase assembly factor CtaG
VVATGPSPLTSWTFDPVALLGVAVAAFLYFRRVQTLERRGTPVETWRQVSFGTGLALVLLAVVSPIHAFGEEQFLFVHMIQHIILGDLGPLAIVAGLTGPILRPLLAFHWVNRLRVLAHPLVAFPIWAITLYVWHVPFMYEAALHHTVLHVLEHACFLAAGLLFWAPIVEPLPGPAWFGTGAKLVYVVAARLTSMVLANVLFWGGEPFYSTYEHPVARWGVSAASDQGIAGGVMMTVDSLVTMAAIAWLFLKLASESELRQQLIERGHDPEAANRAVRYGRADELVRGS